MKCLQVLTQSLERYTQLGLRTAASILTRGCRVSTEAALRGVVWEWRRASELDAAAATVPICIHYVPVKYALSNNIA